MIPVEFLWLVLILVFGIIGMVRGLWKELGVTTILCLSLFVMYLAWSRIGSKLVSLLPGTMPAESVMAIYYTVLISIITFISYEGFTLKFPAAELKGVAKALVGLPGGLLNGYLIVGTIWDVVNQAKYFGLAVPLGATGQQIAISDYLTNLNTTFAKYLPVTLMASSDFVFYGFLGLGMLLLLAIILK
jgi:uncharacterized membrane protein required for colicin V production